MDGWMRIATWQIPGARAVRRAGAMAILWHSLDLLVSYLKKKGDTFLINFEIQTDCRHRTESQSALHPVIHLTANRAARGTRVTIGRKSLA